MYTSKKYRTSSTAGFEVTRVEARNDGWFLCLIRGSTVGANPDDPPEI